jgi:tripartite ATP-independent transporter DctP family solute receptor
MKKTLAGAVLASTMLVLPLQAQELTFGMQDNEQHPLFAGATAMAERLAELSGGTMSIEIFPSSQLGDFRAMVGMVQEGELDLVVTGYPDMSYMIPELALVGEPYVISDYDHLLRVVDGPYGQEMAAKFADQGIHVLDVWYYGTRHTTANKPINEMADLAGLRMRTPNVPFLINYATAVGATPAPVAFAEVYLALQTNQVDAQENPLPTIEAMKFYEVQSSVALTGHFVASSAIHIGKDRWDSLSVEQRGWITDAVHAGREVNNGQLMEREANLVAFFESEGLTVTRPDTTPFRAAMQSSYDKLEEQFGAGRIADLMAQ